MRSIRRGGHSPDPAVSGASVGFIIGAILGGLLGGLIAFSFLVLFFGFGCGLGSGLPWTCAWPEYALQIIGITLVGVLIGAVCAAPVGFVLGVPIGTVMAWLKQKIARRRVLVRD